VLWSYLQSMMTKRSDNEQCKLGIIVKQIRAAGCMYCIRAPVSCYEVRKAGVTLQYTTTIVHQAQVVTRVLNDAVTTFVQTATCNTFSYQNTDVHTHKCTHSHACYNITTLATSVNHTAHTHLSGSSLSQLPTSLAVASRTAAVGS
jgi:hypothetical protein